MATLLRSLRFVRRLNAAGATQRLGAPALRRAELVNSQQSVQCLITALPGDRNYVTKTAVSSQEPKSDFQVDLMLNELDRKVRQFGTIALHEVEEILEAVSRKGFISPNQALLVIRCCGSLLSIENLKARRAMVNNVWETIKALDVPLDVSHYNALLLVNLENETDFSPLNILVEMKEKNIEPNRVTFQRLIEQYCNKGDIAGATKILEHMSKQEVPISENIFNSLIKGHSEAGDVSNAVKILDIMKQAGIEPTANSYTAVLCVHAKRGDIDAIRSTLNECKQKDFILLDKDILEVIYTLACSGYENYIDEMMSLLIKGVTYNRDIKSQILKLIDKNQHSVAYKLLKSMVRSSKRSNNENSGNFFIKKLIINDSKTDIIVNYCKLMKEEKLNDNSFEVAVYAAYTNNMHHLALPLMKAWKESGGEIREHYFFPIIVSFSKTNNLQGILNTMKTMIFDFQITPSILSIKDYIIPFMVEDPIGNVTTLVNNNLPFSTAANAMVTHLLQNNKTREAAKFVSSTNMIYSRRLLIRNLVDAFVKTRDAKAVCEIVHHQYVLKLNNNNNSDENVEDNQTMSAEQFASTVLDKILDNIPNYDMQSVESILEGFLDKGISIDINVAEKVKKYLGDITPKTENILNQLISETLEPKTLNIDSKLFKNVNKKYMNIKDLEEKASASSEFKMVLAQQYAKMRNREAVENLIQEMEQDNINFSIGFCITMIDFYSKSNDSSAAADKWYKILNEMAPDSKINKGILLSYATSLVYENRIADAWKILEHPILDEDSERNILSEKLLKAVYQNSPEDLDKILDVLVKKGFILKVKSSTVAHIIKVHLDRNDIDKAIEKFKWVCEQFKVTPMKNEILINLIQKEDAKALQHVTDLVTQTHGESSALYDLAIAFLDCGRPRQARKVLETPGLRLKRTKIMWNAEKYYDLGRPDKLEKFIQVLTGLYFDMDSIYTILLKTYDKQGEWEKCLSLWTQMQEDNIQPSATFMSELQRILTSYNQKIPFAEPQEQNRNVVKLNEAIAAGDFEKAETIILSVPVTVQSTYYLKLLETYMAQGDLKKVLDKIDDLLNKDVNFTPAYKDFFTSLFTKLINNNEFKNVFKIVWKVRSNSKNKSLNRVLPVTLILNNVVAEAGKFREFINAIDTMLEKENIDRFTFGSLIHDVTIVRALREDPALSEQLREFALKAEKFNVYAPINAYWIYLLVENKPDAEMFWEKHIRQLPVYHSTSATLACKDNNSWDKLPLLAEKLAASETLSFEEKRKNYAAMLKFLIQSDEPQKYEIAFECLRHVVKVIPLSRFNHELITEIEKNLSNGQTLESLKTERNGRETESATG